MTTLTPADQLKLRPGMPEPVANSNPTGPTLAESLMGGLDVDVVLTDDSKERVKVRQIPVIELPEMADASLKGEPSLVAFFVRKPLDWVGRLSWESYELLVQEGDRINGPFLARYIQRQFERRSRQFPELVREATRAFLPSASEPPSS